MPSSPVQDSTAAWPAPLAASLPIPLYLENDYWWAYVNPQAVAVFERKWLVNLILFGNYGRLRDAALADLGEVVQGRTLQMACVYGDLTPQLQAHLAPDAQLDVVDILPIQLHNLQSKLIPDGRIALRQCNCTKLDAPDAHYDQLLMFFLLHEQPEAVRRASLAEALRVLKPGGKLVIVDYHRPVRLHPLRPLMTVVFRKLEPYAMDLWQHEVSEFLPQGVGFQSVTQQTYFGGLYQKLVITR